MEQEQEQVSEEAKQTKSQNQNSCEEKMEISNQDHKEKEETETETPSEKALRNSLVVQMIIWNLDRFSLLKSRGINKLWLELCTKLLHRSRDEDEDDKVLRIHFCYCADTGAYIKDFDGILRGEIKTLESFTQFLRLSINPLDFDHDFDKRGRSSSSSSFPCTNFKFKGLDLSRPEVQDFFRIQGPKIKGLRLCFDFEEKNAVTPESLTDLLMKKAPNVECLSFSAFLFGWNCPPSVLNQRQLLNININVNVNQDVGVDPENPALSLPFFSLGKLRCLRFSQQMFVKTSVLLIKEIALASPALKTVFVRGTSWGDEAELKLGFDYLTSISKSHLITRVELRPTAKNMEILTKFVQSQPRLKFLSLSLDFVDSLTALRAPLSISFENFVTFAIALLESSKETLEHCRMPQGRRIAQFLRCGVVPVLKNVKFVQLYCGEERGRSGWRIPAEKFKEIFPHAPELELGGCPFGGGLLIFPPQEGAPMPVPNPVPVPDPAPIQTLAETDKMPQITNLSLNGKFTREFLNSVPLVFCNVVELWIENKDLIPILPLIWSYTSLRLKVLALDISISPSLVRTPTHFPEDSYPTPVFPGLDAAFTGFPEEACVELLSTYPEILEEEIVKEIRINRSILDLKYLKELRITFDVCADDELPENVLTVVSGAYAFQRMTLEQQLQVHIETKLNPHYDQKMTTLISKKQRAENILKPLLPYAEMTFTIEKREYKHER